MARIKLTDKVLSKKPPSSDIRQVEFWDTMLPGFGVRIGHGGRRAFMMMTRVDGRQRRYTVGTYPAMSLADAREQARKIMRDAAKGIDPKERDARARQEAERARRRTFGAVAEEFMEDHAKHLRTRDELQRMLNRNLLPTWASMPISHITRSDVRELIREKTHTSPIAANRVLALVRKIFNWALDEDIITASPAVRLKAHPENERERVLNEEEIRDFWRACEQMGHPFGPLFRLLLVTAQRRSETSEIRWSDIQDNDWLLPGERTKTGRGHLVPLSSLALEILQDVPETGAYVFSSGMRGDNPVSGWSKAKRRCNELSGIADWRLHDLRRTVATGMRSLGIDRLIVSKVLNHAEAGITRVYDRYAADPEKRHAMAAWANKIEGILSPESNVVEMSPAKL